MVGWELICDLGPPAILHVRKNMREKREKGLGVTAPTIKT
jgi:hypothetical protein